MTFDEWFQSQQGEPYDSMYVFAKAAWKAARQDAFALAAEHARSHGKTLSVINDNEAMEFAGKAIGDSIFKCSNATSHRGAACGASGGLPGYA